MAAGAAALLLMAGCSQATQSAVPPPEPASSSPASQAITPPIAAAWMYMSDDQNYNTIPDEWSQIDFSDVDVLNVGPAGVQADGTFGLYDSAKTGDLANRFKWIIQTARTQNPDIKIIVSQWWGNGAGIWGSALNSLTSSAEVGKYTASVGAFLQSYLSTSGGIDGYDIDYESNNVTGNTTAITQQIRAQLDSLSKATEGRPFYQSVSPSVTSNLAGSVGSLDFVNMQTYAGGTGLTPQNFTGLGYKAQQLLYGICPETNCPTPTLDNVEQQYTKNNLAGIHLWRLNSGNHVHEGQVQAQVFAFLHP